MTGYFRRNRNCLPEIPTAPLGPLNDKFESLASLNYYCNTCNCLRRSLTAATDAIGACHFNGSLCESAVHRRAGLSPPLQRPAAYPT